MKNLVVSDYYSVSHIGRLNLLNRLAIGSTSLVNDLRTMVSEDVQWSLALFLHGIISEIALSILKSS